jgi:hypothetical protein
MPRTPPIHYPACCQSRSGDEVHLERNTYPGVVTKENTTEGGKCAHEVGLHGNRRFDALQVGGAMDGRYSSSGHRVRISSIPGETLVESRGARVDSKGESGMRKMYGASVLIHDP